MESNKVSLYRVFKATPEKVYKAFTTAGAYAAWLPPYGFFAEVQQMDVQVGGKYKMSFTNFSTGSIQSFGGEYVELDPNKFIQFKDRFDDPNLPGEMTTSIWFKKVASGTEVTITQEGIPAVIPADACYVGWQDSLEKLRYLVEPEIADE